MAIMSNADILKMIEERDSFSVFHNGEIERSKEISSRINIISLIKGETVERGKHAALEGLIKQLGKRDYRLCEADVELLRRYNIFASVDTDKTVRDGESFVAVSDFHGYEYPLDKIKNYYVNEYDKVYILGDATDRGPNGDGTNSLSLLLEIKKLCEEYPDKVVYIPGNHDEFLVGSAKGDTNYRMNLAYNGGRETLKDLEELRKNSPFEFMELIKWLETLPIQKMHKFNGKTYALAHAFFDQNLYNERPDYCLRDYMRNSDKYAKSAHSVLWFRKGDGYDRKACPKSGVTMVIGHTRGNPGSRDYDLVDSDGKRVEVNCVDGGIAYDGKMLKYDGNSKGSDITMKYDHKDTSPKKKLDEMVVPRNCLHNYFITGMYYHKERFFDIDKFSIPESINQIEFAKIIDSYEGKYGFSYNTNNVMERYSMYKKIVAFDFIIQNVIDKYESVSIANKVFNSYLFGDAETKSGDECCFSRDRDTRYFAETLGIRNMIDVLAAHNCRSVEEYIDAKTSINTKGKVQVKTL